MVYSYYNGNTFYMIIKNNILCIYLTPLICGYKEELYYTGRIYLNKKRIYMSFATIKLRNSWWWKQRVFVILIVPKEGGI